MTLVRNVRDFTKLSLLGVAVLVLSAGQSQAQNEPEMVSVHGNWTAYTVMEDGKKVCYMVSRPQKDEGNYSKRGDIFALITHRPSENTNNVFSYMTGYPYKSDSEVTLTIDGEAFALFTYEESAWAPDSKTDKRLSDAIQSGSTMIVKGVSSRGTNTTDTFSLKGSSAAHKAISDSCGI
ncbi:MAG: hypothetical protein CL565_03915 [Alphaproteobacteria bacterium]|nr:hypothetical protein [Alphaproteobacteria bacterium]